MSSCTRLCCISIRSSLRRISNQLDAAAAKGKIVFERERCAGCHTPPFYTTNKLVPADGFEPPADHMQRFDILPAGIGVDPSYAHGNAQGHRLLQGTFAEGSVVPRTVRT